MEHQYIKEVSMEDLTNQFLEKTLQYLQSAEAFIVKETPTFVNELISYNMWSIILSISVSVVLLIVLPIVVHKLVKLIINNQGNDDVTLPSTLVTVILVAVSLYTLIGLPCKIDKLIKITVSPRVFLLDYVTEKVKR